MSVSVSNLIQGPGTLYVGAFGAVEPTTPNTIDSAVWTDLGATQDGIKLTINQDFNDLDADQVLDSPGKTRTSRSLMFATNLAEVTLKNLALVQNEATGSVTTGTGVTTFTPSTGVGAFQVPYSAILFVGIAPGGFKRAVIIRRGLSTDNVEFSYKKDDQTVLSVQFEAHTVSSTVPPFVVIDATA